MCKKKLSSARMNRQLPVKSKKLPATNKFIEYWNSLPNTRKHKNPATATYKQAAKYLNAIQQGVYKQRWILDSDPGTAHKYTNNEIKIGLKNLSLLFVEGYWPPDKSKLPRNLQTLLYNPRTSHSMFFQFYDNPPKLLQQVDSNLEKIAREEFANLINYDELPRRARLRFIAGLQKIRGWHSTLLSNARDGDPQASETILYWFPNLEKACSEYCEYLAGLDWLDEVSVGMISTKSKLWKKFIKKQEQELGVELE